MNYTYVNETYNASNSYSIYLKSLATQKYSEILTGSGPVSYTHLFQRNGSI